MKQKNSFKPVLCCISLILSASYSIKSKPIYSSALALIILLSLFQNINAQKLFQINYNIFNPLIIDGTGYGGQSLGTNILVGKGGFEVDYGFTFKKRENRYKYLNPKIKYQFADKRKDGERHAYHYVVLGFNKFIAIKNYTFWGRSESLQAPYWDSTETARTYHEYAVSAETRSSMIEFGYEKVTEKHLSGVAFGKSAIIDPFGNILGWITGTDGSSYELNYTRTFRFSIFAGPKGWMKIKSLSYEKSGASGTIQTTTTEPVVLETKLVNLVGCRIGYLWTTLNPFGTTLGFEIALTPGIFNRHGVYGTGFPDDNIYVKFNLGLAIGNSKDK